jgi:site-specific DNA recombinase
LDRFQSQKVEVQAIQQPIDFKVPEQRIMLAVYISMPESENLRRSMNIRTAIDHAKRAGRYVSTAPLGYSYQKHSDGKKRICPNERAQVVRDIFNEFARNIYSIEQLGRLINSKYNLHICKSHFPRILKNPIYAGKISVVEDGIERTIPAIHEPLIDEATFDNVQLILSGKFRKMYFNTADEGLPLRGALVCPRCGKNLTGSYSRGRHGDRHAYYHCKTPCPARTPAKEANQWVVEYLRSLNIAEPWLVILRKMLIEKYGAAQNDIEVRQADLEKKLSEIEKKFVSLDEKFLGGQIDTESYSRMKKVYSDERAKIRAKVAELARVDGIQVEPLIDGVFDMIKRMDMFYLQSPPVGKIKFLNAVFPRKIIYEKNGGRTPHVNPAIAVLTNTVKALQGLNRSEIYQNMKMLRGVETRGVEPLTSRLPALRSPN